MKHLLLAAAMIFATAAYAADDRPSLSGPHNVSGTLGFAPGGVTISGAYEYMMDASWGVGGYLRMFPKEDSLPNPDEGLMIVGATLGHHFYKKNWDLSFTPGFALINIDAIGGRDDVTTFGPSLGIGLLYQLTGTWAVGFENTRYWVWFDSDWAGELRDDMSFKVRATF
jgi:hypothetical protein